MPQLQEKRSGQASQLAFWRELPTHVWMRISYWWYFAAIGCFLPYIALYYQRLGFSGIQIGVLTTISPIAVALCAPYWGALADTFSAHRMVLRCSLVIAGILALLLMRATLFWPILLLSLGIGASSASIPALLDSYSVTIGTQENIAYGQLRLWGSLGYSVATWGIGWWMGGAVSQAFLMAYAASVFLACGATLGLPTLTQRSEIPLRHGITTVLGLPGMPILLVTLFLAAISTGIVFNYFGIYVAALGGSAQLLGALTAIAAMSELPVLFFGAQMFKHYSSLHVLSMAMILYCVRFAIYTAVPSTAWLIPVQVLHGLTFGALLMASVTFAFELAGPERAATAQGLINSVTYGFGAIAGALLGGALLDRIGITAVMRLATLLMLIALGVLLIGLRLARHDPPKAP